MELSTRYMVLDPMITICLPVGPALRQLHRLWIFLVLFLLSVSSRVGAVGAGPALWQPGPVGAAGELFSP